MNIEKRILYQYRLIKIELRIAECDPGRWMFGYTICMNAWSKCLNTYLEDVRRTGLYYFYYVREECIEEGLKAIRKSVLNGHGLYKYDKDELAAMDAILKAGIKAEKNVIPLDTTMLLLCMNIK